MSKSFSTPEYTQARLDRSWLPLSNRAGANNGPEKPSKARFASEGAEVREDSVAVLSDGQTVAPSWSSAATRWRNWYEDSRGVQTVVKGVESGDLKGFETPNRFTPEYREMLYAKAQSLERGLREEWGKTLHTAMVTLTCSTTDQLGRPRPPVDHLLDLLDSWEAVRRALSRVLDGRDWEYLAILEPHESGYAHIHLAVFVRGPVVAEQFGDVVDAHLRNSDGARREAHELTGEDGVVSVHRTGIDRNGIENLGAYLAAYIGGNYESEATEQPDYVQRFYSLMWATGKQWFRPSNGAQRYMQPEEEDDEQSEPHELVGIAPDGDFEDEGDVIEVEGGGSVTYVRIGDRPPPD